MSKPYSETDFSQQITEDRSWRLKEISDLKAAIIRADINLRRVLLRAMVTICYAHWEGYVRFAARKYLDHVALRRFKFGELDRQFLRNHFLPRLATLATSSLSIKERCALLDEILNSSDRRFARVNEDLVNTRANLSFEVFTDICLVCSVPSNTFAEKADFINLLLLKRRNAVAHGEDTFLAIEGLDNLANDTIDIMRMFGDALENHVYLKDYKSA
ncbi:MAG TPA: MAE_28990/MAE_18760 family HEPN-like nuclease [Bryobacteraceae bacterium]|jgi:hypothetical protein|nr:MAE_28990/MAE_18760 family HEPN-like nuclease [Bryobacteraceae bacterium]